MTIASVPDLVPRRSDGTRVSTGGPVVPSTGRLRPLSQAEIAITGGFWGEYQELNAEVIIGHCLSWMERIGWLRNFDLAASGQIGGGHSGIEFVDSETYKLLEAMAWELGRRKNPALEAQYAELVARVGAVQEADGYVHTSFGRAGQPARYSDLEWGHELYCFGHLIQAAVARLRTGHDDALPAMARRLADHLYREFGPSGRVAVCGHPEIETALVELYRVTGQARYLELATLFIERRGTGTLAPIGYGAEYFQDDMPVREAVTLRGHAVRALYLASGAVDVAVETSDPGLAAAVELHWKNTVSRRTYLTGGMGSHHQDEAFGADYELPPDRAYSETCAGIASVMLSWRLLLRSGEPRYAELIERTLLNNILASPRSDGRAFFYTNTLQQRVAGSVPDEDNVSTRAQSSLRAPWFEVSCCPTNVSRMLASASLYFATASDDGVQLHQYGSYAIDTVVSGARVALHVESGYPFEGDVHITFDADCSGEVELTLRIPIWAGGRATLETESGTVAATASSTRVRRAFRTGESVILHLPVEPRFTEGVARIDAVRGQLAVERGPLVLAIESVDLPEGYDTEHLELDRSAPLRTSERGALVSVRSRSDAADDLEWPYANGQARGPGDTLTVEFTPYHSWANRGPSTMRVWVPVATAEEVSEP